MLRSLLIMVDGKRTVAEVLDRARAVRADAAALATLERVGLIGKRYGAPSSAEGESAPAARSDDEVKRFMAAQQQISDAINKHLGFRGYLMMMRLQRTENLRDLRDFLPDFAQALVKRIGAAAAEPIVSAVERLLTTGS
ncbi:MAG: hypothetical protein ACHP7M_07800 [Burkholderiales bacterium]